MNAVLVSLICFGVISERYTDSNGAIRCAYFPPAVKFAKVCSTTAFAFEIHKTMGSNGEVARSCATASASIGVLPAPVSAESA
jgi:hypothetical protein